MSRADSQSPQRSPRKAQARLAVLLAVFLLLAAGGYWIERALEPRTVPEEAVETGPGDGLLPTREYRGQTYTRRPGMETLLLLGVDRPADREPAGSRSGGQADFLMLLALDHRNGKIYPLQIDRDTMTDVPVTGVLGNDTGTRYMQICLAHGYGATDEARCKHAVQAVQTLLDGEPVKLYIAVKLDAIGALNRALGGVRVTLPEDFSVLDPAMKKGADLVLTDAQAEILVRSRREVGDGSNAQRMLRQRAFLRAASAKLQERLSSDPGFVGTLLDTVEKTVSCSNMQRGEMIGKINRAYGYDIQPIETLAGEYQLSPQGFMEFYADKDAILQWILQTLYEPKE